MGPAANTDPAPEAFRLDSETGQVGLIDWTGATRGPLLYDIASAVMYLGGLATASTFLGTYRDEGPVPSAELRDHLRAMRRYRAAVQAGYFSVRLARHDLTGIAHAAENRKGLHDARNMASELGLIEIERPTEL